MHRFLIIIEKANGNFSAYSPDLPGCIATGSTQEEVKRDMKAAVEMHITGLKEENKAIPKSQSSAEFVVIP